MINVEYRPEGDLMDVELTGKIQFAQMKEYCLNLSKVVRSTSSKQLRILEDTSEAELVYNAIEAERLGIFVKEKFNSELTIKHALICNKPIETAYGIIRMHVTTNERYKLRVFSSLENGIDWLMSV